MATGVTWPEGTNVVADDFGIQDRRDIRGDELDDGAIRQERITTAGLSERPIQLFFETDAAMLAFRAWARINSHTWFDWSDPFDGEVRAAFVINGSGGIRYAARVVNGVRTWSARCTILVRDI